MSVGGRTCSNTNYIYINLKKINLYKISQRRIGKRRYSTVDYRISNQHLKNNVSICTG